MSANTVADVARVIVSMQAPEELREFDLVAGAFDAAPGAARRAGNASNETTASSATIAGETMTTLALLVSSDVARSLLLTGQTAAIAWWDPRGWRRARPTVTEPAPPIIEDQAAAVEDRFRDELRAHGMDDALADSMASAARSSWPRRLS
jgi:hypothetical protein